MLWRIDGTNTYLLGSIHITDMEPFRLPNEVSAVLNASDTVVFEADTSVPPDLRPLMLAQGESLSQWVTAETLEQVRAHYARLNMPEDDLLSSKPGFVGMRLTMNEGAARGFLPARGVDHQLKARCIHEQKSVLYLEDFNAQIAILGSTPLDEQANLLAISAQSADVGFWEVLEFWHGWLAGTPQAIEKGLTRRLQLWPRGTEIVVDRRNRTWVPQIVELARSSKRCLVVMGALHMAGKGGIPALLAQEGLTTSIQPWTWAN